MQLTDLTEAKRQAAARPVSFYERERAAGVINLQIPMATCCICGEADISSWGVPIAGDGEMVGLIVPNDYEGEWAAAPACRDCWLKHENGEFNGHDPAY